MNRIVLNSIAIIVFMLVGSLIYSNTLSSQFVLDSQRIKENQDLRISSLTFESLYGAVFHKKSFRNRPLPNLSFALNYYFDRYNVKYYHIVNISLHIITGVLLFFLFGALLHYSRPKPAGGYPLFAAFAAALIWLVHPLNTQSVNYIVQRSNIMAALFCISSLLMYIYSRKKKIRVQRIVLLAAAILFWLLALGCKQNAAVWPFIVCLFEWYFIQDMRKEWLRENLKYFVGIFLLFCLVAFIYLGPNPITKLASIRDFADAKFTLMERALTQFRVVVYYLSLYFFPIPSRFNLDYDFPLSYSLLNPVTTLFSAILITGFLITGFLTARKQRLISFCIFWCFLNLAIESSVIPLAIIFEHRTYMPFMGLSLLVVLLVDRYLKTLWLKVVLLCLAVSVLGYWTYQRNEIWRDPVTLWQDVVTKAPATSRPHTNFGLALYHNNQTRAAIAQYKAALALEPGQQEALINLGVAYHRRKRDDAAIESFKTALQGDPDNPITLNYLGVVLKNQGRFSEAVDYFRAALKQDPESAATLNNLGSALMDQGKTEQAVQQFRAALKFDPANPDVLTSLGAARLSQQDFAGAAGFFKAALKLDPDNIAALNHLGLLHVSKGELSKALALFQHASELDPNIARTQVNLGAAYLKMGNLDKAITHLETALKLDPLLAEAHTNLGIGLIRRGDFKKGFSHVQKALALEPGNEKARSNFNKAQALKRQVVSAIAERLKAAGADPRNPRIYLDVADLYQSIGENDTAIEVLKQALEKNPASDAVLNRLGNLYLAEEQYPQALAVFKKHLSLDPDFSLPYYNLARWYARQKLRAEAVAWLQKALARGYANWEQIKTDADLDSIRLTDGYKALLKGH